VAGVEVHGYVGQVELLERVCDAIAVARGGGLAGLDVAVGDEVGEGVGLDDQGDGDLGVLLEDCDDGFRCQWRGQVNIVVETHGQCTATCTHQAGQQRVRRWRPSRRSHGLGGRR
jgi:hypothetical protein